MKKNINQVNGKDSEVQQRIESGAHPSNTDEQAYWLVFRALHKEIEIPLSDSFAERVTFLVKERQAESTKRKSLFDFILFAVGVLVLIVAFIVSVAMTEFTFDLGFLKALNDYRGLIVMGVLLVIAFNIIDVRVIRKHQNTF